MRNGGALNAGDGRGRTDRRVKVVAGGCAGLRRAISGDSLQHGQPPRIEPKVGVAQTVERANEQSDAPVNRAIESATCATTSIRCVEAAVRRRRFVQRSTGRQTRRADTAMSTAGRSPAPPQGTAAARRQGRRAIERNREGHRLAIERDERCGPILEQCSEPRQPPAPAAAAISQPSMSSSRTAGAPGPERRTHGQLAAPRLGPRQLKIGDVQACHQQHERSGGEQQRHRRRQLLGQHRVAAALRAEAPSARQGGRSPHVLRRRTASSSPRAARASALAPGVPARSTMTFRARKKSHL